MYTKADYIGAVHAFNNVKSFNIMLPDKEFENDELYNEFYEQLADQFTDKIMKMRSILEIYEDCRKRGIVNNGTSSEICVFVVHINQVTNNFKSFDDPIASLYD